MKTIIALLLLMASTTSLFAADAPPATTMVATAPASAPATQAFPKGTLVLPTYGLALTPPPSAGGWLVNPHPASQDAASWAIRDPLTNLLRAEIKVTVKPGPVPDQKMLTTFAENLNAKLLPQKFEIDHNPAFAMKKDSASDGNSPQLRLITCREGLVYTFLATANPDPTTWGNLNPNHDLIGLIKSVHWIPIEDPLDHLADGGVPEQISILNRRATIEIPAIFRMSNASATVNDQAQTFFTVTDHKLRHPIVLITIDLKPAPPVGVPLSEVSSDRRPALKNARSDDLDSDANPPIPGARASKLLDFTREKNGVRDPAHQRVIEIYTNDGGFIRIFATIFSDDEVMLNRWDKALLQITNSIKLAPGVAATAPNTPEPPHDFTPMTPDDLKFTPGNPP